MSSYVALDDNGLLLEEPKVAPADEPSDVPLDGNRSPGLSAVPLVLHTLVQHLLQKHLHARHTLNTVFESTNPIYIQKGSKLFKRHSSVQKATPSPNS